MKERESVLENFIFRNEYTHFIGHLDSGARGCIGLHFHWHQREDKIKYMLQTGAISLYFSSLTLLVGLNFSHCHLNNTKLLFN